MGQCQDFLALASRFLYLCVIFFYLCVESFCPCFPNKKDFLFIKRVVHITNEKYYVYL